MLAFGVEQTCVSKPEIAAQDRKVTCLVYKTGNGKQSPIDVKHKQTVNPRKDQNRDRNDHVR